MPIYTYLCDTCKVEFELEQKLKEEPIKDCFYCSGKVKRIIVPGTSFKLLGSGWFSDGYQKSNKKS